MTAHRTATAAVVALTAPLLLLSSACPASAHGAPTSPVSRVFACSPEGGAANRSAACRAAVAANGAPFTAWDNLRVAGVNGRDREVIPDGRLCSGGLPAYKGLDLARADFPSTRMTPGASFTLAYSSTIAHTGTFRLYLTKPGYDPNRPLRWSDLPARPFATATDPALVDGAYRIRAKLPADRTGRQMLFTVWQNTSTPDTYYSCSDVVLSGGPAASTPTRSAGAPAGTGTSSGGRGAHSPSAVPAAPSSPAVASASGVTSAPASSEAASSVTASPAAAARTDDLTPAADSTSGGGATLPLAAGGAAALLLTAGVAVTLRRRR
ncbi:lytic polysaccharide monooxygenase [Streptomyces sp. NPDC048566]|uniref:lytic polysaccharide monooxygenase auxiliary activity family 9 protein n=1 Tax=Streptomyces sp. NPDC048566 TaxID=3365569 RepID=UPI00371CAC2F